MLRTSDSLLVLVVLVLVLARERERRVDLIARS